MFSTSWRLRGDRLFADLTALDQRVVLFLDELPIFLHRLLINEAREIDAAGISRAEEFLTWLRAVALRHAERLQAAGEPVADRIELAIGPGGRAAFHRGLVAETLGRAAQDVADGLAARVPDGARQFARHVVSPVGLACSFGRTVYNSGRQL